ncbi:ABC transporter family protein [Keratinibaculum paraultunense]|uniref:ABC transporter family protein n=1 Tax=Keratinibaculum paraultunense TaxID=1278232 RepID=A0A4R3KZD1_9FIRM|nr:ABC transporter ATP-binding protein [Keratinibaculum paraultunense]TCS91686.1 ABC transporter family protein [Keratinibaculum paraultunense]
MKTYELKNGTKAFKYGYPIETGAIISGGQRQRVALGRAIVRKPQVFLMDEPLSNLDAKLREHMRVELVRLHKTLGSTTVYVTHDQTEAMTMATKIVLMNDGKIQQAGKPEELYNKPANIFVAEFIGSPTMNIIEGSMIDSKFVSKDGIIKVKPSEEDGKLLKSFEGKEKILYARLENGYELTISVPGHYEYNEGEKHSFGYDISALHFFNSKNGERIN